MSIAIETLGGNCPVQAEGTFDGTPFYFRARGTSVRCEVGEWTWHGPVYEWPDAGWISEELAQAYIAAAYREWQRRDDTERRTRREYRDRNDRQSRGLSALQWAGQLQNALGDTALPCVERLNAIAKELLERPARSGAGEG